MPPLLVHSQTMSNSSYILREGNLETPSDTTASNNNSKSNNNYKVRVGFTYPSSSNSSNGNNLFSFSLSNNSVNFGTLAPGEPIIRTGTLTISNPNSEGYQVLTSEDHPLKIISSHTIIPDTTCDSGNCSEITSSAWTSLLTYGFGYRCDDLSGSDCSAGFSDPTFYKHFSDSSAHESEEAVMAGNVENNNIQAQISYKVNITSTQQSGLYQNLVTYIAIPNY